MSELGLVISVIALVVAIVALWLARNARGGAAAVRGIANYTIAGNLKITNDCDGQSDSIPAQVVVRTSLSNAAGNIQVPRDLVVNVQQDPANPDNPIKVGTYTITVRWPDADNDPVHWTAPKVLDRFGVRPVCREISCPEGSQCEDMVNPESDAEDDAEDVPANNVPANNLQTNHDVQVVCACRWPPSAK